MNQAEEFKNKFQEKYAEYFTWKQIKEAKGSDPLDKEISTENLLMLKHAFDKHGLKFWLAFGTALGAYRDNDFISYDNDTDIGIFHNDMGKLFDITDDLINVGLFPVRTFCGADCDIENPKDIISGISYGRKGEYVDVCFWEKINDKYWCLTHWSELHQFDKLDTITFLGEEFNMPSDIENHFVSRYGEDWQTPIKGRSAMSPVI